MTHADRVRADLLEAPRDVQKVIHWHPLPLVEVLRLLLIRLTGHQLALQKGPEGAHRSRHLDRVQTLENAEDVVSCPNPRRFFGPLATHASKCPLRLLAPLWAAELGHGRSNC